MEKLVQIINKYKLDHIKDRIEELENFDKEVTIAFLGEFSSGKSSLINALLQRKVLPTMDKPTSKRVVEIKAADVDKIVPYKKTDDKLEPIDMIDFNDMSVIPGQETIYLEVPYNDFFKKGYMIVDTPGIDSIDKMDSDITFGYLYNIDGAVICQDIQKGSLPDSMLRFLLKPEIRPIVDNFIFAITKGDLKPNRQSREKIKSEVIAQLQSLKEKHGLELTDIAEKVVVVSIHEELDEFKRSYRKHIELRKSEMVERRKEKEIEKLTQIVIEELKKHKQNLSLSLDEIEQKEKDLEQSIKSLEHMQKNLQMKIKRTDSVLYKELNAILDKTIKEFQHIKTLEEAQSIESDLNNRIEKTVKNHIDRIFKDENMELNLDNINISLADEVRSILDWTDKGKALGTFILVDLLLPGGGLAGAAEGGAGAYARQVAKKAIVNVGTGNAKKNRWLQALAQVIQTINPVEHIGDFAKTKIIEHALESKKSQVIKDVVGMVTYSIEWALEDKVNDIVLQAQTQRELLAKLIEEKGKKIQDFSQYLSQIDHDISLLTKRA